jgi:predicted site-specific integrase-resolvase
MVTAKRGEPLKQVAESFGASYDTFFRAYQAGRIKVIRLGNRLIVPSAEIERIAREGLTPARNDAQ